MDGFVVPVQGRDYHPWQKPILNCQGYLCYRSPFALKITIRNILNRFSNKIFTLHFGEYIAFAEKTVPSSRDNTTMSGKSPLRLVSPLLLPLNLDHGESMETGTATMFIERKREGNDGPSPKRKKRRIRSPGLPES